MYGTGVADVWEVYGGHNHVTQLAWKQGRKTSGPHNARQWQSEYDRYYVSDTITKRQPRIVAIEIPSKVWKGSRVMYQDDGSAKQQKRRECL